MSLALLFSLGALATAPRPGGNATLRIAVLLSQESPAYRTAVGSFRSLLQSRGLLVELDQRKPGAFDAESMRQIRAAEPNLVLAFGAGAASAAAKQLAPVPVVAVTLRKADFGSGAITGIYLEFPPEVEFEWMRRLLPKARRVGVLYNPAENAATIARATSAAASLGLELLPRKVESRERLNDALASLANDAQVLWAVADTLVLTPETARSFLLFEFRQRIPFVGLSDAWVQAGAFYALDRDWTDLGKQCAELAEQILRGRDPRSFEPAPPRRVTYSVNARTAETLKLTLPQALVP